MAGTSANNNHPDARYKTDIASPNGALVRVLARAAVSSDWRHDEFRELHFDEGRRFGFTAQELKQVLPEAVSTDKDDVHSVAYTKAVPVLVEALKEPKRRTDEALKARDAEIESLKRAMAELKKLVETLALQQKGGAR